MPGLRPADVVGRRAAAALIDIAAIAVLFVAFGLVFGDTNAANSDGQASASVSVSGARAVIFLALVLVYYFGWETASGQTLGKWLLGLRVRRVDGRRASARAIALRTGLRVVDVLPVLYLFGFLVVLATGSRAQRIGDIAARTTVIRV